MPQSPLRDPSAPAARLAGLAKAIPAVGGLFSTLIVFNGAQTASLAVRPLSRQAFRGFNRWAADLWWGWCVSAAEAIHGTRIEVTGDELPKRENAVVVVNHQQMADITYLMFLARQKGRLGDMKWFVKDPIKYVPGVGWGMLFLDCIFLKRDWLTDRRSIEETFRRLTADRVPVWLMSFVEGTRVTPEKVARSRSFARKRGLEPTDHVLIPRTKGFVATVGAMRSYADAVYDITIGYPDGVPSLWQYAQGFTRQAHLHVRRYPMAILPESDAALTTWLLARFREKDALLAEFYRTGRFPETSGEFTSALGRDR